MTIENHSHSWIDIINDVLTPTEKQNLGLPVFVVFSKMGRCAIEGCDANQVQAKYYHLSFEELQQLEKLYKSYQENDGIVSLIVDGALFNQIHHTRGST